MKKVKPFSRKQVKECPITEGRTYLAEVIVDPWANHDGHMSCLGQLVKVRAYGVVNVEWPGGGKNSFSRDSVRIIGEYKP